jgi:hypothetical protein
MSDNHSKKGPSNPERRLLEAMVTLNAINHGRPVPDMSRIHGGWVARLTPSMTKDEQRHALIAAAARSDVRIKLSKTD